MRDDSNPPNSENGHSNPERTETERIIGKLIKTGLNYCAQAVGTSGAGVIYSSLGFPEVATLTAIVQSLCRNTFSGAVTVTGQFYKRVEGDAEGEHQIIPNFVFNEIDNRQDQLRHEIIIASYLLTFSYVALSIVLYVGAHFVMPIISSEETARLTSNFLLWTSPATIPTLLLPMIAQIALAHHHDTSTVVSSWLNRIPAVLLSYLFTYHTSLGINGVTLGNAIAPCLSYLGMEIFMRRDEQISRLMKPSWPSHNTWLCFVKLFCRSPAMLAQKVTEWGNLALTTVIIGKKDHANLALTDPSTQILSLFNLYAQGVGIAGNMSLEKLMCEFRVLSNKTNVDNNQYQKLVNTQREIKSVVYKALAVGFISNIVFAGISFAVQTPLCNLFLGDGKTTEQHQAAEKLLWINLISLFLDSFRIVSATLLNASDTIWVPNGFSFMIMTAGLFASAYGLQDQGNDKGLSNIFWARNGTILIAAVFNCVLIYHYIFKKNANVLENLQPNQESVPNTENIASSNCLSSLFKFPWFSKEKKQGYTLLSPNDRESPSPV